MPEQHTRANLVDLPYDPLNPESAEAHGGKLLRKLIDNGGTLDEAVTALNMFRTALAIRTVQLVKDITNPDRTQQVTELVDDIMTIIDLIVVRTSKDTV